MTLCNFTYQTTIKLRSNAHQRPRWSQPPRGWWSSIQSPDHTSSLLHRLFGKDHTLRISQTPHTLNAGRQANPHIQLLNIINPLRPDYFIYYQLNYKYFYLLLCNLYSDNDTLSQYLYLNGEHLGT